ncbi:hypothetical protein N0V88_001711 [Collariella sp. IMI 366227]|nr:hypothetical protein N0V88_001711 [Collariella sp. IMI 366227]
MAFGSNLSTPSTDREVEFPKGPEDTISALRWSPVAHHLAASCWDGKVYIYDASNPTSTDTIRGVAAITAGAPVLDCDFSKDGTLVAGAGADQKIHIMDLNSQQTMTLEGHTSPVRSVRFVEIPSANGPILASGSWDKTVRYWPPVHFVDLHGDPLKVSRVVKSPLSNQTCAVSLSADGSRWAVGGIEGRASAQVADEKDETLKPLSFKCHREPSPTKKNQTDVYTVNTVCFDPSQKDVLVTAGSDGSYAPWDLTLRRRLNTYPKAAGPVTSVAFRHDGRALAYAVGYDWSKGFMHHDLAGGVRKIVVRVLGGPMKK